MKKTIFLLALFLILSSSTSRAHAATDTLIRHDSVKVFIDRLIIENPEAIRKLTDPASIKIPTSKKVCGWAMVLSGVCAGAFSIVNLTEAGEQGHQDDWGQALERKRWRMTGYYEINICLSAGLIAAGASLLFK
jgi:hypothetical protein